MQLPDAEKLAQKLADQIKPRLTGGTALVGIHTGGVWLAEKLQSLLGQHIPLGTLDISFYRDDFSRIGLHPVVRPSVIPFEVNDSHIILVDDVLYTGRTVRAALNNLFDYGRPASISLAVLIDRSQRELPISAEFVGSHLALTPEQNIQLGRTESGELELSLKAIS